jgi:hypothetical protein
MKTLPNQFSPTGQTGPQFQPGDRVIFTPTNPAISWAAGERTVLAVEGEFVKLFCGDIRLVARANELTKI